MKASEILEHFLSRAAWVDHAHTVDRIIIGDPEREVDRCLVTWISSFAAVRNAVKKGLHLLITHEPTFYHHAQELEHIDASAIAREKQRYVAEHGLTILRLHDTWDRWPEVGIPWAWARFLGLANPPAAIGANGYQHRYDIKPTPLKTLAKRIAQRTAAIGESHVQVTGQLAQSVSKIGVGTGCGCDVGTFQEMGCDVSIVCDDGTCYWSAIQQAEDQGHPVIRVNHGTSEEPGMVTLTQYINQNLPGVVAEHLPHGSTFRLVGGNDV